MTTARPIHSREWKRAKRKSEAHRRAWADPEIRARTIAAIRHAVSLPEWRKRFEAGLAKAPKTRNRQSRYAKRKPPERLAPLWRMINGAWVNVNNDRSSSGRTSAFGTENGGSIPPRSTK